MHKKTFLKTICAGLLVFTFVFMPVSLNTNDKHVSLNETEAFLGAGDPATMWLMLKESILDAIVWELINLVLEEIVKSMTDWVRSGFRGSPAFVTDFSGFMLEEVSDQVEMAFIDGTVLEDLCSPFSFQVKAGLDLAYSNTTRYKAGCTLDDIVDNIDDFVDGDFYAGGWDGWAAMTMNEQNNFYGSSFRAQAGLEGAIRTSTGQELAYLNFGSGFFGQEQCNENGECQRVTPGETVNESLNNALNIGNNRLELADEFNELFGALFSQLMKQVLGGDGGGLADFKSRDTNWVEDGSAPSGADIGAATDAANQSGQQDIDRDLDDLADDRDDFFDDLFPPEDPDDGEEIARLDEGREMVAAAAEFCRNEFNRPLSDDLVRVGYSIAWGDDNTNSEDLQDQVDEYIDNNCEELQ